MTSPLLYSQENEEAILGAAMLSRTAAEIALTHVVPSDFALPSHAAVFEAIGQLYRDGASIEPLTVRDALQRAGVTQPNGGELVALQAGAPGGHWQPMWQPYRDAADVEDETKPNDRHAAPLVGRFTRPEDPSALLARLTVEVGSCAPAVTLVSLEPAFRKLPRLLKAKDFRLGAARLDAFDPLVCQ